MDMSLWTQAVLKMTLYFEFVWWSYLAYLLKSLLIILAQVKIFMDFLDPKAYYL